MVALRELHVPNVRWPVLFLGATNTIGATGLVTMTARKATVNANCGSGTGINSRTDEYMIFINQIGSDAYVSVNVIPVTLPSEAAWLTMISRQCWHHARRNGSQWPSLRCTG